MFGVFVKRLEGPAIHTLWLAICACIFAFIVSALWAHTGQRSVTGVLQNARGEVIQRRKAALTPTGAPLSLNSRTSPGKHAHGYLTRLKTSHVLHDGAVLQEATVSEEQWLPNQSPACKIGRDISAGTINSTPLIGGFQCTTTK
jgi:hypothetical protein